MSTPILLPLHRLLVKCPINVWLQLLHKRFKVIIYYQSHSYNHLAFVVIDFLVEKDKILFNEIMHKSPFDGVFVILSQPYFGQVWGWSPTLGKSEDLESSGTPECLELDSKAQNTLHWGVLGVIGKVLKRRYKKWPRIGHLNIYSPSYGQKKGQESNWQFDPRPLKVGNRPVPDLRIESAIRRWKDLGEGYKFGLDLVAIRLCSRELWAPKVPGLHLGQFRDNFGTPTWESREKVTFGRGCCGESQSILYRE